ncbi:substrate-binding domain-containing protein [Sphaerotilus sp.]|uniref:substrate-binding domain-containing protein n=1 Tax=Sphaerotilus sp. TaxID=2093942 RepID=UPI002ACD9A59|nr:substrate-binding domain-containing protein [Sphaerotilus sp.]MDZ7858142.1 substrate-binding domain-containing protein [Sphaerotilus sp.]
MALSPGRRAAITVLVTAAFGGALYFALRGQQQEQAAQIEQQEVASATVLRGVISLDVEGYFKDPRVQKRLAAQRLPVEVVRVGSREMASRVVAGSAPDFFFTAGVVSANQIVEAARKANLPAVQVAPFHSPLVIASWEPIAKILVANGLAKAVSPKVYSVDTEQLTKLMLARKRWKDLKDSGGYDVSRSVLVSTTDLRRSNSGALYLALTSAALNGDVVTDRATGQKLALQLTELFKRQGYQENYVDGNFDDYVSIGIGKTPMAFLYEFQIVRHALQKKGIGADMVLMYPQPTIVNKEVFVSLNERAKALGELLASDAELQGIAVEYGFRIADTERFVAAVKPTGLAVEPRVTQLVDPPSPEVMTEMIDTVAREMTQ